MSANMNNDRPQIRGKVVAVLPTFTSASGFTKRDVVVETGFRYANPIKVTFRKEQAVLLDDIVEGDTVSVHYGLFGREWEGPRGTQYFVDVVGFDLDVEGGAAARPKPVEGATKEGAVTVWLRKHPEDEKLAGLGKFCKELKPGVASKDYKAADWADVVNAINGVAADGGTDAAAEADGGDPDDLPF